VADANAPARRWRCGRCERAACICPLLNAPGLPVRSAVALLILQHPREQHEAKGTAQLLHLAVAGSRLLVGAAWPQPVAAQSGVGSAASSAAQSGLTGRSVLLYPPTPGVPALPEPPPLPAEALTDPAGLQLVLLDATWRKSLRVLHDSPWLQGLPRLALAAPPASRYAIRRARGEGQRSSFEAGALALAQLGQPVAPLWLLFDAFVRGQQALASAGQAARGATGPLKASGP
jgi:DTW domain-containing protein YfiP